MEAFKLWFGRYNGLEPKLKIYVKVHLNDLISIRFCVKLGIGKGVLEGIHSFTIKHGLDKPFHKICDFFLRFVEFLVSF